MKKLSEFSMKETRALVITLMSELKTIISDEDLKAILKALADVKSGGSTDITRIDAVFAVVNSLLITNENAFWTILAAFMQSTVENVQDMNNIEVLQTVADFLSVEAYKKLFLSALK